MLEKIIKKPALIGVNNTGNSIKNFSSSIIKFYRNGLRVVNEIELNKRIEICSLCKFWNSKGFNGTGKCEKCGCSTWAKLRMETERCPLGKWEAVSAEDSKQQIIVEQQY